MQPRGLPGFWTGFEACRPFLLLVCLVFVSEGTSAGWPRTFFSTRFPRRPLRASSENRETAMRRRNKMNMRAKRNLALILSLSLGLLAFAGCSGAPAAV